MLLRAYRLCSSWHTFEKECTYLTNMFARLDYPVAHVQSCIKDILESHFCSQRNDPGLCEDKLTFRLPLPFKSQSLAQRTRVELRDLSRNLPCTVQPVFQSRKLRFLLSQPEEKDALVSNARCVYLYSCACDKHYVGYTTRHLHQRVTEHQRSTSAIAKHCSSSGCSFAPERFSIIARCASKFELQVRESLEIYFRKPELNDRDEYCCSVLYRSRY